MEAIVLAGGFGTRLREVVPGLPKPMAPIAGHPFLEIVLEGLARKGFSRVVMSLGYMANVIHSYFGSSYAGMEILYEIEEAPLGTGGAIRQAIDRIVSDHVFVVNGDTFLDLEVLEVEKLWNRWRQPIIVAREVSDTSRYGRIEMAEGLVTRFSEKGIAGGGLINAGCYVFPKGALNAFAKGTRFSLEMDFLAPTVGNKIFRAFVTSSLFIDIGVPDDYSRAQKELAGLFV